IIRRWAMPSKGRSPLAHNDLTSDREFDLKIHELGRRQLRSNTSPLEMVRSNIPFIDKEDTVHEYDTP
ncbi:MAG TPA: hypothetical protein ACFE0H_13865, partial [Elainellaceae cyanobacterium]